MQPFAKLAIGVAALVVTLAAATTLTRQRSTTLPSSNLTKASSGLRFLAPDLSPGDMRVYRVRLVESDTSAKTPERVIDATLRVTGIGSATRATMARLAIDTTHETNTHDVAYVVLQDGFVTDLRVDTNASADFVSTIDRVVSASSIRTASVEDWQWSTVQRGAFGISNVKYIENPDRSRLERETTDVLEPDDANLGGQTGSGTTHIQLRNENVTALVDIGTLRVAEGRHRTRRVDLNFLEATKATPPPVDLTTTRSVEAVIVGTDAEYTRLVARTKGLTRAALASNLRDFGILGKLPNQHRLFYQGTALLQLTPEAASDVTSLFFEPDASYSGRAFFADLLAHAGTPAAQTELVNILADTRTVNEPYYPQLLQRIAFVRRPTEATSAWAAKLFDQYARVHPIPDGKSAGSDRDDEGTERTSRKQWETRAASTLAIGALVHNLSTSGQTARISSAHDRLLEGARSAQSNLELGIALRGLGNAGLVEGRNVIVNATTHRDADVRATAADSLWSYNVKEVHLCLIALLRDEDELVQRLAQRSLLGMDLAQPEQIAIATVVGAQSNTHLDHGWVTWLHTRAALPVDTSEAMVEALRKRNTHDPQLLARLTTLIRH